jgi:hypothetical protein
MPTSKCPIMKLFMLFQTDKWKSKASRVFFGIFDCRNKALDFAKYNSLTQMDSQIVVIEVGLNEFGEI